MPTPISHAAVGFAIGAWGPHDVPPSTRRVCWAAAACAALPDIDVIGFASHRGITHSLFFAAVAGCAAAFLLFPKLQSRRARFQVMLILVLALLSHSVLDGFSAYSRDIAYFAPFSSQRFRFAWTPLGSTSLAGQLLQEALVLFIPAVVLAWLGLRRRRAAPV